ncbi:MAG TPA: YkvA family protein [Fimbriimonas sp.]|nr:YkvA family protein [Fimbriimonas sp.]
MKFIGIARTLIRYWQMAHDPRTPKVVRYMIYGGLAYSLSPIDLLPDWIPGVGLLDDAAVLPGIIALSMVLIPQKVKEQHEVKSETGIAQKQAEGIEARKDDAQNSATSPQPLVRTGSGHA